MGRSLATFHCSPLPSAASQRPDAHARESVFQADDPEYMPQEGRTEPLGDSDEFKLGGTPVYVQDDNFVLDQLVLQFNKYSLPFELDIGVGFLTVNKMATEGAFLWQAG